MKSYTDIEQSKKLAEFLPIESADMRYGYIAPYNYSDRMYDGGYDEVPYPKDFLKKNPNFSENEYEGELPCWSLSALLELIPTAIDEYTDDFSQLELTKQSVSYVYAMGNLRKGFLKDNLLDAAFQIVIWLKENNKL